MNGNDLLQAMSYVDERHIQEAETASVAGSKAWLRWGALAACFVLVVAAGIMVPGIGNKISMESSREDYMPNGNSDMAGTMEMVTDAAMETVAEGDTDITDGQLQAPEAVAPAEVPSVLLRIDTWQENGFTATVEEIVDTDIFPVGTQLTVEFAQDIRVLERNGETVSCTERTPTQADFPAGSVVHVMFGLRDQSTILVEQIGWEDAF